VTSYLHEVGGLPPKVGVLLELDTETDFVAKTPDVRQLARNLAMHVAAMEPAGCRARTCPRISSNPSARSLPPRTRLPQAGEHPGQDHRGQVSSVLSGKGGVLLEQPYVKDESGKKKVSEVVAEVASAMKENLSFDASPASGSAKRTKAAMRAAYRRVLLKLSGEIFSGSEGASGSTPGW